MLFSSYLRDSRLVDQPPPHEIEIGKHPILPVFAMNDRPRGKGKAWVSFQGCWSVWRDVERCTARLSVDSNTGIEVTVFSVLALCRRKELTIIRLWPSGSGLTVYRT